MRNRIVIGLMALAGSTWAADFPAAKDILDSVRLRQTEQDLELQGQLRENEKIIAFRLTQTGPVIRYTFTNPDETLQLRLGDNDSRLEEVTRGGTEKITGAQFDHKVRGTGVSYEDLALKFLYWPDAKVTGENSIRTRNCWRPRANRSTAMFGFGWTKMAARSCGWRVTIGKANWQSGSR